MAAPSRARWRTPATGAALAAIGTAVFVLWPAADSHTFLVRTVPEQGERLDATPPEVSLKFSEAFSEPGAHLQ